MFVDPFEKVLVKLVQTARRGRVVYSVIPQFKLTLERSKGVRVHVKMYAIVSRNADANQTLNADGNGCSVSRVLGGPEENHKVSQVLGRTRTSRTLSHSTHWQFRGEGEKLFQVLFI